MRQYHFLSAGAAVVAALPLFVFFSACGQSGTEASSSGGGGSDTAYYTPEDFDKVVKYDTHVHFNMYDTTFLHLAATDNFRFLDVNVGPYYYPPIETQRSIATRLIKEYPGRVSYATTFSMKGWGSREWQQRTLDYLKASFRQGAIAVKVWKNIGMEIRDKNGKFVMIDDPAFDTIFRYMALHNITLLGHLGEPRNCWLPVEQMTVKGDKEYFASHPIYHMYLHPEFPSYEDQIRAKDHLLEKNPDLHFVGAHLGSLEWSVDELAKRLDKYPNMAVDMAQRISHLQYQAVDNWQKVHDFFIRYQDRLLYATDSEVDSTKTPAQRNKDTHEIWVRHWKFFTSGEKMKVPKVEKEFYGMRLPKEVVDKIYRKNAERWFPGLVNPTQYMHADSAFCTMADFATMDKTIIHVHIKTYDTAFLQQAMKDGFRLLTINNNSPSSPPIAAQQEVALRLMKEYPGRIAYATTFSLSGWDSAGWLERNLQYLQSSFAKGALAVKAWKNIGMALRDKDGKFVMIDDARFDPIFDLIEKNNKTLIGHLGEPKDCWLPVDKMTVNSDKRYYQAHPEYHMYLHPDYPSYEDQIRARDHMLDKHPGLRFIGAHLGSLEWSVDELARRLDKYPNMAVDVAERICHLEYQALTNWQKVHDFIIKYQDRLIYATDQTVNGGPAGPAFLQEAHATWLRDWRFFVTGEMMTAPEVEGSFKGMHLPRAVIEKIYRINAERWIKGLAGKF